MIAYGVCVRSQARFELFGLPGIVDHCGEDDALLTATETGRAAGYNEILDGAAALEGVQAVVLLDEDVEIADPAFREKALRALAGGSDIVGVVGGTGGDSLDWWSWEKRYGGLLTKHGMVLFQSAPESVDAVDGTCMVLSPRAVEALRFDAKNFPGEHGFDIDLCFQALEKGLRVEVANLTVYRHGEGTDDRELGLDAAAAAFQAKWAGILGAGLLGSSSVAECGRSPVSASTQSGAQGGFDRIAGTKFEKEAPSSYYGFERPELVALVPEGARRVLDVGCAAGALGAAVKRRLPQCEVSGIEYVQSVVERAATRLDHAFRADLNAPIELAFPSGYFDAMIFGDVLEHLLDPEQSLRGLLPYLAPEGVVIASIPNVKHWSVMVPALAQDRWEYTDAGLLDKTHVHLFTLHEAMRMFDALGLGELQHIGANVIPMEPPEHVEPLVNAAVSYGADANSVRQLLNSYQYLLVVRRTRSR